MSINKFQETILKSGCGTAVLYVSAAVFFGGMFYLGCGLGGGIKNPNDPTARVVAVQVGEVPVYADDLAKMMNDQRQQTIQQSGRAGSPDAISPLEEAQIDANVLENAVSGNAAYSLALKRGVKFTDAAISKEEEKQLDQEMMMTRMQLVQGGKLKPDATDKDFDAVLQKQEGMSATQRKTMFHTRLVEALKDKKIRPELEVSLARQLLLDAITSSIKPTLAELKASYDSYVFKRILFAQHPGATVDSQIAKAQADLKAGQSFEQVVDRYSSEPPIKGKKLSDNTINLTAAQFDSNPDYKALKPLKQGQTSDVIDTAQGKAIYKLTAIKPSGPPDLESNKAKYEQSYASQKAQTELTETLKGFLKSDQVKWNNASLKALFDWSQLRQDTSIPASEVPTKMAGIVDEAKKAFTSSQGDTRPALLAWFAAFDTIWNAPTADKVKLRGDRIEVIKAVITSLPSFALKMELIDLLVDAKATDEAVSTLADLSASNFQYDPEGQRDYQDIQGKLLKLKAAGLVKPDKEAAIVKSQQDWLKQNELATEEKAQQKKEQEAAEKEAAANAAKQKAETDKQKAEADKAKGAAPKGPAASAPASAPPSAPASAPASAPVSSPAPAKKQ